MKRISPLLLAVLLSSCGTYVRVQHPWVATGVSAPDLPGMGNLYVVLDRYDAAVPWGFAGKTAGALLARAVGSSSNSAVNRPLSPGEEAGILRGLSSNLRGPWIGLTGCSVACGTTTRFLEEIRPSMVLVVKPGLVEGRQDRIEAPVTDSTGRETGKRIVYRLFARFEVSYELKEWPSGRVAARGAFSREAGGESPGEANLSGWLSAQSAIQVDWIGSLRSGLVPVPVERTRRVREGKKLELFEAAWNAGINCEKAGDWAGARAHYASARLGAKTTADQRDLDLYIRELGLIVPAPRVPAVHPLPDWWAEPVAILPFSNDSNNIPAPEGLRRMAAIRLEMMGYRVVPLETTDAGLRARGVTLGEHLRALKPGDIAPAAGANRLIGGKVEEFSTVNIGIYYKREVRVRLWMLDAGGLPLWESVGTGFMEAASDRPGETFLAQLFGGMGQKMTGTYLKEEAEAAVLGAVESLPAGK